MTNVDAIRFRMYNTGSVGDCLLLLFEKDKVVSFSMLVDCGGWLTQSKDISACVQDIKTTCDSSLDLLVVTHQHTDHLSGFNQARELFDKITVKEVWMSWIEDAGDKIAELLKEKYGKKIKELRKITNRAVKKLDAHAEMNVGVQAVNKRMKKKAQSLRYAVDILDFEEGIVNQKGAAAGKATNDQAMEYVRKKSKTIHYRRPGDVVQNMKGAEGMKFFFLGPPRDADMKFLKIDLEEEEMYHLAATAAGDTGEPKAEDDIVISGVLLEDGVSPFGAEYKMDQQEIKMFNKYYNAKENSWRQIETDWEEAAASIALRVTNLTNNTSLAMAIEFEETEKVILLPGDAQSGNWMSWHKPDVMKALKEKGGKDTVALLEKTIFYKVGHHGSHNGTASISGLDHMKSRDLVAFMPLVKDKVPAAWGGPKNFPAKKLYDVLIEKTNGRLVRTDEGLIKDPRAVKLRGQLSTDAKTDLKQNYKEGAYFKEYRIIK